MLIDKEKFEFIIDRKVSEDEWVEAMDWYSNCTLDENDFCSAYASNQAAIIKDMTKIISSNAVSKNAIYVETMKAVNAILEIAALNDIHELRKPIRDLIGIEEYVRICIEKSYDLEKEDREYILEHI